MSSSISLQSFVVIFNTQIQLNNAHTWITTLTGAICARRTMMKVGSSCCSSLCCIHVRFLLRFYNVFLVTDSFVAEPVRNLQRQTECFTNDPILCTEPIQAQHNKLSKVIQFSISLAPDNATSCYEIYHKQRKQTG